MYILSPVCVSAQRLALVALGRTAERRPNGKRLRRRKLLENAADSPAATARRVRPHALMEPSHRCRKFLGARWKPRWQGGTADFTCPYYDTTAGEIPEPTPTREQGDETAPY